MEGAAPPPNPSAWLRATINGKTHTKMKNFLRTALAVLGLLPLVNLCTDSFAASAQVPYEFFDDNFYKNASPAELRAKLKGISLQGVSRRWHNHYTSITPLMLAAKFSPHPEAIDIMLEAGSELEAVSQTPWQPGDTRSYCWDHELTALHFAANNEHSEVLERLLEYKPNLDRVTVCSEDFTALRMTAGREKLHKNFIILLKAGANTHISLNNPTGDSAYKLKENEFPLWYRFTGRTDVGGLPVRDPVELTAALLATGYPVDEDTLNRVLHAGQYESAKLMIKAGVGPKVQGALCSALASYRQTGHFEKVFPDPDLELLSLLLEIDDVNAPCRDKKLPLQHACRSGMSAGVARLLVEAGADIHVPYFQPDEDEKDPAKPESSKAVESDFPGKDLVQKWKPKVGKALESAGIDLAAKEPANNSGDKAPPTQEVPYYPESTLIREALESRRDNPELIRYLLDLGLSASTLLGQQDYIVQAVWGAWKKPLSAIELIKDGANPMQLRVDRSTREIAKKAGILDKYDRALISGTMSEATRKRQAYERKITMDTGPRAGIWSYMQCALPEDIRKRAQTLELGKVARKSDKSKASTKSAKPYGSASFSSYFKRDRSKGSVGGGFAWTFLTGVAELHPYEESIEILAKMNADFYETDGTPIRSAFENPNHKVATAILRHSPAEDITEALTRYMSWTHTAHPEHAAVLKKAGFDLNSKTQDESFIKGEKRPVSNVILSALRGENYAFVRELIKLGVDFSYPNEDNARALDILIAYGQYELAIAALDAGADCTYTPVQYSRNMLEFVEKYSPREPKQEADYQRLLGRVKKECVR